jgi:hypothetical protein
MEFIRKKDLERWCKVPCGPSCWYKPFTGLVNGSRVSLKRLVVFHMDGCLDWRAFFTGPWAATSPFWRRTGTGSCPAPSRS